MNKILDRLWRVAHLINKKKKSKGPKSAILPFHIMKMNT